MCRPGAWVDDSDCRALEQKSQKVLGHYFPWIVKNNWKQWPTLKVFKTSPPRLQNTTPSGQKEIPSRQLEWNVGKGFIFEGKNSIIAEACEVLCILCCMRAIAPMLQHEGSGKMLSCESCSIRAALWILLHRCKWMWRRECCSVNVEPKMREYHAQMRWHWQHKICCAFALV